MGRTGERNLPSFHFKVEVMIILHRLKIGLLKQVILRPLSLLFAIGIVSAILCFFILRSQISTYSHLSTLQEGNGICFSRVTQTFTAAMMRKLGSQHLSFPFIEMTEECYGDIAENFYSEFKTSFPFVGEQLGRIATDAHWFHEKLNNKVISLGAGAATIENSFVSLENQFAKVESLHDEINKILESKKGQAYRQFHFSIMALFLSLLALLIAFIGYFVQEFSVRRFHQSLERRAGQEVDQENPSLAQVKRLLSDILKWHGHNRYEGLFTKWHAQFIAELEESISPLGKHPIPQKSATSLDRDDQEALSPRLLHRLVKGRKRELLKAKHFLGRAAD